VGRFPLGWSPDVSPEDAIVLWGRIGSVNVSGTEVMMMVPDTFGEMLSLTVMSGSGW